MITNVIVSMLALHCHADGLPSRTEAVRAAAPQTRERRRLDFFGAAGAGFGTVDAPDYARSPSGPHYMLGLGVSYAAPRWVADAELGWLYSSIEGGDRWNRSIDIHTRAVVLELSPRYRISSHWQLGPVVSLASGTDTRFGPGIGDTGVSSFAGIKAAYELRSGDFPIRVWQQAATDVSISGRQVYLAMAGVQVGLPVRPRSAPEPARASAPVRRVVLDPRKISFRSNSAILEIEARAELREIGAYLARTDAGWQAIAIAGHADQRGTREHNIRLSGLRAESVRAALIEGGVAPSKLAIEAFGSERPEDRRDAPAGWARNRRVEIVLKGAQTQ